LVLEKQTGDTNLIKCMARCELDLYIHENFLMICKMKIKPDFDIFSFYLWAIGYIYCSTGPKYINGIARI
jgi:hypothetical protein